MFVTGVPSVEAQRVRATFTAIDDILDGLGETFESVDAANVALQAAQRLTSRLAGLQARAVGVCEETNLPESSGSSDTATWVSNTTGMSRSDATRRVRLSETLHNCPRTATALRDGQLTPDHAAILSRAVDEGLFGDARQTEDALLGAATQLTPERFRRHVRRLQHEHTPPQTAAERERQAYERSWITLTPDPDGGPMEQVRGELDPITGQYVKRALDALSSPDGADVPEGQRRTQGQRAARALGQMARFALDHAAAPATKQALPHVMVLMDDHTFFASQPSASATHGSDTATGSAAPGTYGGTTGPATTGATAAPGGDVAIRTAAPDTATGSEASMTSSTAAEFADGTPLSLDATRRILCDAEIRRVVLDPAGQPVNVGRATRKWSAAQRAAIVARDRHCRWPGCQRPESWCVIHHVTWYSRGGETNIRNGVLLCGYHHQQVVHDESKGWTLRIDPLDAAVTVTDRHGTATVSRPPERVGHRRQIHAPSDATPHRRSDATPAQHSDHLSHDASRETDQMVLTAPG